MPGVYISLKMVSVVKSKSMRIRIYYSQYLSMFYGE